MNAQERLHAAHLAAAAGRHEEALSEYVWFHNHALAERPSLYGVRLSFALSYWKELGEVYPPALLALREIRDEKTKHLASGSADRELFHDVEAINQYLGANVETARLFESIDRERPDFAKSCANLAMEVLVETGMYHLAAKYLPDPIPRITELTQGVNSDIARISERPRSKSPRYRAYTWNCALDLRTMIAVLSGSGRSVEAEICRATALSLLKPWYVRKAVERALASDA